MASVQCLDAVVSLKNNLFTLLLCTQLGHSDNLAVDKLTTLNFRAIALLGTHASHLIFFQMGLSMPLCCVLCVTMYIHVRVCVYACICASPVVYVCIPG